MSSVYDAILLIAFGGPTCPEEIRPFLARVTKGLPIPPARLEEVAHHYEAVGGKSPLNEITMRQAAALKNELKSLHHPLPVYLGMRNAAPFFADTLMQMAGDGIKRALGFILSSHRTEASWERYQQNITDARAEVGAHAPAVDYCGGWHDHPLFIETWAESIRTELDRLPTARRRKVPVILTAHSLPTAMAARSPYVAQLEESARMITAKLDHPHWQLAYQSRSGRPSDPWLEPDIGHAIRDCAARGEKDIVVAPVGFVCDHVEVLYDLDIEAKKIAEGLGLRMYRVSCPNDHPT
ncbi:MAG: ferrochelatase, partial [Deltaproteobacteria bacterium]|nr:ferrochelatase [Deltaproteobacteria bacterium]